MIKFRFHVESSLKKSLNRMESRLFFKISDRYKELNNVLVAGTGQSAMIAPFFALLSQRRPCDLEIIANIFIYNWDWRDECAHQGRVNLLAAGTQIKTMWAERKTHSAEVSSAPGLFLRNNLSFPCQSFLYYPQENIIPNLYGNGWIQGTTMQKLGIILMLLQTTEPRHFIFIAFP